jgi:hypothetical protein
MKNLTIEFQNSMYEATIIHKQTSVGITYEIKISDCNLIEALGGVSIFHINPTIPDGLNIIKHSEADKEFQIAICNAILMNRVGKHGFISYT